MERAEYGKIPRVYRYLHILMATLCAFATMSANDPPIPELSQRQHDILESITRGLTNKEIALQFDISLESVKSHIKVILEKLNASSRTEAASIAQRKHLLKV